MGKRHKQHKTKFRIDAIRLYETSDKNASVDWNQEHLSSGMKAIWVTLAGL